MEHGLCHADQSEPSIHDSQSEPYIHASQLEPYIHASQSEPYIHASQSESSIHASQSEPSIHDSQSEPYIHDSQSEPSTRRTIYCIVQIGLQVALYTTTLDYTDSEPAFSFSNRLPTTKNVVFDQQKSASLNLIIIEHFSELLLG